MPVPAPRPDREVQLPSTCLCGDWLIRSRQGLQPDPDPGVAAVQLRSRPRDRGRTLRLPEAGLAGTFPGGPTAFPPDTLERVLARLDPAPLEVCCARWVQSLVVIGARSTARRSVARKTRSGGCLSCIGSVPGRTTCWPSRGTRRCTRPGSRLRGRAGGGLQGLRPWLPQNRESEPRPHRAAWLTDAWNPGVPRVM